MHIVCAEVLRNLAAGLCDGDPMTVTTPSKTSILREEFGGLPTGESVYRYVLDNGILTVGLITFGARLTYLYAPNRDHKCANVVLGCETLADYVAARGVYLGATCGRFANRIAGASIEVDGIVYRLSANERGLNTLHGGAVGFDSKVWDATVVTDGVRFSLVSEGGDQGFPGRFRADVTYQLSGSSLRIEYEYESDRPTVANLTNHAYFNLAGEGSGSIAEHALSVRASNFLPVDEEFIPTGEIAPVENTPFDFRTEAVIGDRLRSSDRQLELSRGFNHTYALNPDSAGPAATLRCPASGRRMRVSTSEPGIHLYTAGFLDGSIRGSSGRYYEREAGICLETQHFPDSPHRPSFPSTTLEAGKIYRSETVFEFSTFKS
jgi:aldose 1-epimerase